MKYVSIPIVSRKIHKLIGHKKKLEMAYLKRSIERTSFSSALIPL